MDIVEEKRFGRRIELESLAKINIVDDAREGVLVDISRSGLRIRTTANIQPGLELTLLLFNRTIRCQSKVCWVHRKEGYLEAGLELRYIEQGFLDDLIPHLPKKLDKLDIHLLACNESSAEPISVYLELVGIGANIIFDTADLLEDLSKKTCDLIIIDASILGLYDFLKQIVQSPRLTYLPLIIITETLTRELVQFCATHPFVEVLTKPFHAQDFILRSLVLIEQSHHYMQMHGQTKSSSNASDYLPRRQDNMLDMLSQVTKELKAMEKLVHLQEALLELKSLEDVTSFFQKWVLLNFGTAINLWHYHQRKLYLLEDILIPFGDLSAEERQSRIYRMIKGQENILQDKVTLIQKNNFFLEVLSSKPSREMVKSLSFFMKVLVPILQSKLQELELKKAYIETEQALEKERDSRKLLNREIQAAAEFQHILIPTRPPKLETLDVGMHYQSAADLGGDWFDICEFPNLEQIMVAIGDVTGHGAQASLVTAVVSGFFSDFKKRYDVLTDPLVDRHQFPGPGAILNRLNRVLCDTTKSNYHMTMFLCFLDQTNLELSYASASHTPLILYRESGFETTVPSKRGKRHTKQLMEWGMRLGNKENSVYGESSIQLMPGDVLVWYTDGIIEYINESGDCYSVRRLLRLIPEIADQTSQEMVNRIVHEVQEFGGFVEPEDDLAVIVCKVR